MEELTKIQSELKAPKNQYNSFGKYNYRSCEDILEALKPLLLKHKCTLTIADEIKECGGLVYVEARVEISTGDEHLIVTAQAGINPDRKGMDISQSFGSSSSYARKYALNGLFLIDDTKDADTKDNSAEPSKKKTETPKEELFPNTMLWTNAVLKLNKGETTINKIKLACKLSKENEEKLKKELKP